MALLKQSSTAQPLVFLLVSSTDKATGVTGLTPTVTLSKSGGPFASCAGTVSEIANGWYKVAGNATDTNTLGPLILRATGTGADPVDMLFDVVAFDPQTAYLVSSDISGLATASALTTVGTNVSTAVTQTTASATRAALGMAAADLDTQLDAILDASGSGGTGVTVYASATYAGPVPDNTALPIVLYKGRKASLPFVFAAYDGEIADGDSVTLRILPIDTYGDTSESTIVALVEATAVASLADGTLTLTWELSAADTDDLPAGADGAGTTIYKMLAGSTTGDEYPVIDRGCVVKRYPGAPV